MPEVQITYNYIVNIVKQFCKNNSKNYQNLDAIPAYYKNGYSASQDQGFGNYVTLRLTRATSNGITAVADSTIESDMSSFLSSTLGMNNARLAKVVNNNNYMNFLCDMAIFITTKMCITTSNDYSLSSDHKTYPTSGNVPASLVVYIASNNTYSNIRPLDLDSIDRNENQLVLTANEVIKQLQAIISTVARSSGRTYSNKINFGITLL